LDSCAVGSENDFRVEQREKCAEVTAARGSEEGVDDFALAGAIGESASSASCSGSVPSSRLAFGSVRSASSGSSRRDLNRTHPDTLITRRNTDAVSGLFPA